MKLRIKNSVLTMVGLLCLQVLPQVGYDSASFQSQYQAFQERVEALVVNADTRSDVIDDIKDQIDGMRDWIHSNEEEIEMHTRVTYLSSDALEREAGLKRVRELQRYNSILRGIVERFDELLKQASGSREVDEKYRERVGELSTNLHTEKVSGEAKFSGAQVAALAAGGVILVQTAVSLHDKMRGSSETPSSHHASVDEAKTDILRHNFIDCARSSKDSANECRPVAIAYMQAGGEEAYNIVRAFLADDMPKEI